MNRPAEAPQARSDRPFLPARPLNWFLHLAQSLIRIELAFTNQLHIEESDLRLLHDIPKNAGIILTPNHADEMDPSVCMELARLSKRQFIFMGNREAFDEWNGLAGWGLQRLGVFSVERGGHDSTAIDFALDVVRQARDVLVIFPEGEIYYLNDVVQPFHSGAVNIGMRALCERRRSEPDWNAYIVPLAIKYRYKQSLQPVLEKRMLAMERRLAFDSTGNALRTRLALMFSAVLVEEETAHHLQAESERFDQLGERIKVVRHEILAQVEQRYAGVAAEQARTIDRAWQLSAHLRSMISKSTTGQHRAIIESDLAQLKEVAQMASWQPEYWEDSSSDEHLAEAVLKLERQIYRIKRPSQLARRDVFLRVGQPLRLGDFIADYEQDPRALGHGLTEKLRETIQGLINEIDRSTG